MRQSTRRGHRLAMLLLLVPVLWSGGCYRRGSGADPTWGSSPRPARSDRGEAVQPNLSVIIHEELLNNLVQAIDTVRQERHVLVKSSLTGYTVSVPPPMVEIDEQGVLLRTRVTVLGLGKDYTTPAVGRGRVVYDQKREALFLEIGALTVDIHTELLGVKLKLSEVDISELISPRLKLFDGLPLATDFEMKRARGGKTRMKLDVVRHQIGYRPGEIVLDLRVDFQAMPQDSGSLLR